jgi:molybdate transport system ATP-binding protein
MRPREPNLLRLKVQLPLPEFGLDVSEEFVLNGVTGVFGPSGGGKSTLLRVIAGLERMAAGRIEFAGETWLDSEQGVFVPACERSIGYVFQDARLFPHLTVEGNLRYADRRSRVGHGSIHYDEIISTFQLVPLLDRRIDALSGGERQRIALARTLLTRPRLLLLDEPLAALDVARKWEILPFLEALSSRFGIPAIYVSHSIDEIARLADHVVVLERGQVTAMGPAAGVLNQHELQAAGSGLEVGTILECSVIRHLSDMRLTSLDFHRQTVVVPILEHLDVGATVRLHVRAGDVALATRKPEGLSFRNVLRGTVSDVTTDPGSAFSTAAVEVDGALLRSRVTRHAVEELGLRPGLSVYALLKTASFDHRVPPLA